jgi:CelD/BcsL family acetyltransferase involved in cellulose biosynthesis
VIYSFNPLEDSRWAKFLEDHPCSSVFHTQPWLAALRRTYGYQPVAFSTSPPGACLTNAIVFCEIRSWLTGRRLVSLPFSDHCDPLIDPETGLETFLPHLRNELTARKLRHFEIRPIEPLSGDFGPFSTHSYCLHSLDLTPSLDTLFHNLHQNSTRRKIRRAEREGLTSEAGSSPALLDAFYRLLLLTRRRHAIPPQPKRWFENLIHSFGPALEIRVAFHRDRPVAAILTLRHKDTLVYKYGCSDARFHNLGGVHLLFWNSITDAKQNGMRTFDLGRSDWEDQGLITFKNRWGARQSELIYLRIGNRSASSAHSNTSETGWKRRLAKGILAHLPVPVLRIAGELFYRHVG